MFKAGVSISHLDSHQFVHLMPGLLSVVLEITTTYQILFVRGAIVDYPSSEAGLRRLVQWAGLSLWFRGHTSRFLAPFCRVIPSVDFIHAEGRLTREGLLRMLNRLSCRTVGLTFEVILHPVIGDPHTLSLYRHWGYDWKNDLELLLDDNLKDDLAARCGKVFVTSTPYDRWQCPSLDIGFF